MFLDADYKPEFESYTGRLLELAQIRSVDQLLQRVVALLAERPYVAAARIWLVDDGDICSTCYLLSRCQNRASCLHLVASAGKRRHEDTPDWLRTDGEYQRIPLSVGKIGVVATTGEAVVVKDFSEDPAWLERYQWAALEHIRGFNAQPIRFKDKVLGVLAVFTSIPTPDEGRHWLRILADHIAVALTNAQAFEQIERLRAQVETENVYLQEEVREAKAFGDIIGQSALMQKLQRQLDMVAPTDATVLVLGESGTGKELVAREIHRRSRRRDRPLIRVNCASVPRDLYESEFFGHVRGAFTGAIKDRSGRFEAANGGTLFLDEVGEIPPELQSKFLRVLQERQYERVGEERTRKVDVRIVAATNRDLKKEVEEGRFRQDLYYRLNVFPIEVPPLRERRDDIALLAARFLEQSSQRLHLPICRLTEAHNRLLMSYDWPGNVRELQNAVDRALILAQSGVLQFDIPITEVTTSPPKPEAPPGSPGGTTPILTDLELRQWEVQNTLAALTKCGWKIHGEGGAAELLGVKPTTLLSRIKKLNLKRPDPAATH
jgi:transcriptional regulator with GAF, ATPase, and Fis domain